MTLVAAALGLASLFTGARAHEGRGPPRQPPAEAYSACEGKRANDECSVVVPGGTLSGTCVADEDRVFCRPERPPFAPPPEAFAACAGKAANDACSVAFDAREIDGTCQTSQDGQMFCRPANPPPPPER